jgi:uncharacterized membrane protein YdfJ with MMPL/SSD domain
VDTFVVRHLLVPTIATMLGRWNWVWPGISLWKSMAVEDATPDDRTTSNSSSRQDAQPV